MSKDERHEDEQRVPAKIGPGSRDDEPPTGLRARAAGKAARLLEESARRHAHRRRMKGLLKTAGATTRTV